MELFELIPEKFFSILTGKNKKVYAVAILLLNSMINVNDLNIKKDDFARFLREKATEIVDEFSIEEETNIENTHSAPINTNFKANEIVKRLEECGWIEVDMDGESFDEYIILPSYSIKMIQTINDIINESSETYSSLVHTTYSELLLEDQTKDEFMYACLLRAFENTKKLKVDLITLSHSIRIYQSRLNKLYTSNEVLHSYFDNYKDLVSDRLYHPLKTFDSVARFKRPIINILSSWINNKEIRESLIKQGLIYSKDSTSPIDVEKEIIMKVNYICDMYETINGLIDQIDIKHREYTKSSTNKILYLNNKDKTVKSMLENILIGFSSNKETPKVQRDILSNMQKSINFYENGYINSESVTLPIYRKFATEQNPLEVLDDLGANDYIMQNFLASIDGMFTDEKIFEFMKECFGEEKEIRSEDISLVNDDAFIMLILSTLKNSDKRCFYTVDYESKEKINNNGYIIPKLIFRIKEEE